MVPRQLPVARHAHASLLLAIAGIETELMGLAGHRLVCVDLDVAASAQGRFVRASHHRGA